MDASSPFARLLEAIAEGARGLPVVFPVHPRTAKQLREMEGQIPGMHYVDPQGYLEFNYLVRHAKGVITDSGGITEETTVMGVPCLTLRDNTERPETVTLGTNELVDPADAGTILATVRAPASRGRLATPPTIPLWDGHASERGVEAIGAWARRR